MTPRADTRARIVEAALEAVKTKGFAGTSTRAIAAIGGFNPALIFYYFGSLNDLLVAALERTSGERLARYRAAAEEAGSLSELVRLLARIYEEDVASGHIRVVSELVTGSVSQPVLAPRVLALMEPWIELTESAIERALSGSPLAELVSPRELAVAAVTFYLGANLLTQLEGERTSVAAALDAAARLAPLVDELLTMTEREGGAA